MKIEEGVCPKCGCTDLQYEAMEVEGTMIYYPYTCPGCNRTGEEWYSLSFAGHNIDDEIYQV